MARQISVALKLEIERVNLLYRLNIPGVFALLLYASAHAYVCGSVMTIPTLIGWLLLVFVSAIVRVWASWRWFKINKTVTAQSEIKKWSRIIQALLGISGVIWGIAGWMAQYSQNSTQQMFTAMTLTFMAAGALVCWAVSIPAMMMVVLPSVVPWAVGFFMSQNSDLTFMGVLALTYLALGIKVAFTLNHFVTSSFKLTIENEHLSGELQQEMEVKNQAEESLHLALSSSDAMGWSWNSQQDVFICSGDLRLSLGLNRNFFSGTLDEFLELLIPEDRIRLHTLLHTLTLQGGALDADVGVRWSDNGVRDLAFRGRVITAGADNKMVSVSGIAWNATARKSQAKLQQERDIFDAANKAKSVFLANASHEMRTPLAAIEGYTEALLQNFKEGKIDEKQMSSDLQSISRNGKYLASLMNDFLDLSKIESSRYVVNKSSVNLKNEINEAIQMVQSEVDKKNLRFELLFNEPLPEFIDTDPMRLRQILVNLFSNAIKFTHEGTITLCVKHDGKILAIRMRDTGIGMNDETKVGLFEPFTRGNSTDVQKVRGSGLGLALSRKLASLLGGNLALISSEPGKGSEFELKLAAVTKSIGDTPSEGKAKLPSNKALTGMQILVVDDDDDLRELMQRFLQRSGAQVETCINGQEGIRIALEKYFDVVVMDMKMPVLDGYAATRHLREKGYKRAIVAVSAHASGDEKAKCLAAGCDQYLSKPIDFAAVISVLSKYARA